jgi:hypothetical protein
MTYGATELWIVAPRGVELKYVVTLDVFCTERSARDAALARCSKLEDFVVYHCLMCGVATLPEPRWITTEPAEAP